MRAGAMCLAGHISLFSLSSGSPGWRSFWKYSPGLSDRQPEYYPKSYLPIRAVVPRSKHRTSILLKPPFNIEALRQSMSPRYWMGDSLSCALARAAGLTEQGRRRLCMKQILQNQKTGELIVADVPAPAVQRGRVLVRAVASLISAGTERTAVDMGRKGLLGRAWGNPS